MENAMKPTTIFKGDYFCRIFFRWHRTSSKLDPPKNWMVFCRADVGCAFAATSLKEWSRWWPWCTGILIFLNSGYTLWNQRHLKNGETWPAWWISEHDRCPWTLVLVLRAIYRWTVLSVVRATCSWSPVFDAFCLFCKFLLGWPNFRGYVSLRDGNPSEFSSKINSWSLYLRYFRFDGPKWMSEMKTRYHAVNP